ncbi:MAG: ABC transporter permease [Bacillota bacterium]
MSNAGRLLRQAAILAAKDLKMFLLDRGSLLFALVFPFAFVVMFSLMMGPSFGEDKPVVVHLVTAEPEGSISHQITEGMAASAEGFQVRRLAPEEARRALLKREIGGYLFFPPGFSEAVMRGQPTRLTVYYHPEAVTARAALTSVARAIATEIRSYQVMYRAIAELAGPAGTGSVPGQGAGPPGGWGPGRPADALGVRAVFEQVGEIEAARPVDFLVPGYLTMFVFFALSFTGASLLAERESYTLERLVAASASRGSILAGKMAGAFLRGLVQVVIFWVAGILVFHVRMGHYPAAVVLVSVLLTVVSAAVGVFLATVARTRKGAASMAVFISLGAAALGGCWWPLFIMPRWLQNLARITPHAWANSAFNKLMLFGATPQDVVPELGALALFAVLFGVLGVWRFRLE